MRMTLKYGWTAVILLSAAAGARAEDASISVQVNTNVSIRSGSNRAALSAMFPPMPPGVMYSKSILVNPSQRPYMGLQIRDLTEQLAGYFNVPDGGILVESVAPDGPARDSGVQAGDIITSFNGEPLKSCRQVFSELDAHEPGDKAMLTVRRRDEEIKLDLVFAENPMRGGSIAIPRGIQDTGDAEQRPGEPVRIDVSELVRSMAKSMPPLPPVITSSADVDSLRKDVKILQEEINRLRVAIQTMLDQEKEKTASRE